MSFTRLHEFQWRRPCLRIIHVNVPKHLSRNRRYSNTRNANAISSKEQVSFCPIQRGHSTPQSGNQTIISKRNQPESNKFHKQTYSSEEIVSAWFNRRGQGTPECGNASIISKGNQLRPNIYPHKRTEEKRFESKRLNIQTNAGFISSRS